MMRHDRVGDWTDRIEHLFQAACDLFSGLFSLPTADAAPDCDYARELEHRYSKPRRCC